MRALFTAIAVAAALLLFGCGEDESDTDPAQLDEQTDEGLPAVAIGEILDQPDEFGEVRIEGTGRPLTEPQADNLVQPLGFVVEDDTGAILVLAAQTPASLVEGGEELVVVGDVRDLAEWRARELRSTLGGDGQKPQNLADIPLEPGAPYIELINVRDEAGEGSGSG